MNIVFLGSGAFGIPTLQRLLQSPQRVIHVFTQPDRPAGRGRHPTPTPVADFAQLHGLPLTRVPNINAPAILAQLEVLKPDILVVIAFGQKLSDPLLALAPLGGVNLHASLLPEFRGAAPIHHAILSRATHTGVSVIRITQRMDAGDILATASTAIGMEETAGELHDRLALLGAPLVGDLLDRWDQGVTIPAIPQDETHASHAPKLNRAMAGIDFARSATDISAHIRGLSPWPGCVVDVFTPEGRQRTRAIIIKCRANPHAPSPAGTAPGTVQPDLTIACGTGTLSLLTLQPVGRKAMDIATFSNGYGLAAEYRLQSTLPPLADTAPQKNK